MTVALENRNGHLLATTLARVWADVSQRWVITS